MTRYSVLRTPLRECFALTRDDDCGIREFVAVGGVRLELRQRAANDNARLRFT